VCVAEPLKVARLMAGLDDHADEELIIVPRLPLGWTGLKVESLPVRIAAGHARLDFEVIADTATGAVLSVHGKCEAALPVMRVRLGTAIQPVWKTVAAGAREFVVGRDR
jgi:hypothetical protein